MLVDYVQQNENGMRREQNALGPFQDAPITRNRFVAMFSFDGVAIPRFTTYAKMAFTSIPRMNTYWTLLTLTIFVILVGISVPFIVGKFVETPYCDTNSNEISGEYAVFYDTIPLQSIVTCKSCPHEAKCNNGNAECDSDDYHVDKSGKICLSDGEMIAEDIAYLV